jgi:hypothetical protein
LRIAGLAIMVVGLLMLLAPPAQAELPPGYNPVPGTVPLNPADVGAVGNTFTQDCTGLPRPVGPGEVAWHFILPESVLADPVSSTPRNIFDTLTVTFATAGPITLSAIGDFGPPSQAHAYVYTPTNDTLTAGVATIGRLLVTDPLLLNDPKFNLSHTCASTEPPTTTTGSTTTTTEATTTTTGGSTTTTTEGTTTTTGGSTTTTSGGTTTTTPEGTTTTTGGSTTTTAAATTTSSAGSTTTGPTDPGASTTVAPTDPGSAVSGSGTGRLATTGSRHSETWKLGVIALMIGGFIFVMARRMDAVRTDA